MKNKNLKISIALACVLLLTVLTGLVSAETELSCGETYSGVVSPYPVYYVHSYSFTNPSDNDIVVTIEGESGCALQVETSYPYEYEMPSYSLPSFGEIGSIIAAQIHANLCANLLEASAAGEEELTQEMEDYCARVLEASATVDVEEITWLARWPAGPGTIRYIYLVNLYNEECEYEIEIDCDFGTILIFESVMTTPGSSVQIPITIENAQEIGNMDLVLRYDPTALTATDVIEGSLTQGSMFQSNIEDGTIRIAFVDTAGISGDGSIAYITFDVVRELGSLLIIESVRANDIDGEEVSITTINGVLIIGESKGDCNRDGEITNVDATMALQMSVGILDVDFVADMDDDGEVTSFDAAEIQRIAGIFTVAEIIEESLAAPEIMGEAAAEIIEESLAAPEIMEERAEIMGEIGREQARGIRDTEVNPEPLP